MTAVYVRHNLRDQNGRFISKIEYLKRSNQDNINLRNTKLYEHLRSVNAFKSNQFRDLYGFSQLFKSKIQTTDDFKILLCYLNDTKQVILWIYVNTIEKLYTESNVLSDSMLKVLFEDNCQLQLLSDQSSMQYRRYLYSNMFLNLHALENGWITFNDLIERFEKYNVLRLSLNFIVRHPEYLFDYNSNQLKSYLTDEDLIMFQQKASSCLTLHEFEYLNFLRSSPQFVEYIIEKRLLCLDCIRKNCQASMKPEKLLKKFKKFFAKFSNKDFEI